MRSTGRVYVLTNPSMPDLIKIGYTDRTAQDRADELYFGYGPEGDRKAVTGVPTMYEVKREWLVGFNAEEVEQRLHDKFDYARVSEWREFFDKDILPEVDKEMAQYERLDIFQYSEPSPARNTKLSHEDAIEELDAEIAAMERQVGISNTPCRLEFSSGKKTAAELFEAARAVDLDYLNDMAERIKATEAREKSKTRKAVKAVSDHLFPITEEQERKAKKNNTIMQVVGWGLFFFIGLIIAAINN